MATTPKPLTLYSQTPGADRVWATNSYFKQDVQFMCTPDDYLLGANGLLTDLLQSKTYYIFAANKAIADAIIAAYGIEESTVLRKYFTELSDKKVLINTNLVLVPIPKQVEGEDDVYPDIAVNYFSLIPKRNGEGYEVALHAGSPFTPTCAVLVRQRVYIEGVQMNLTSDDASWLSINSKPISCPSYNSIPFSLPLELQDIRQVETNFGIPLIVMEPSLKTEKDGKPMAYLVQSGPTLFFDDVKNGGQDGVPISPHYYLPTAVQKGRVRFMVSWVDWVEAVTAPLQGSCYLIAFDNSRPIYGLALGTVSKYVPPIP